jgi:hypothetical protein
MAFSMTGAGSGDPMSSEPRVCVVVPLAAREELSASEELSLRHLETFLSSHDRCFVAGPDFGGSVLKRAGYDVNRFDASFFGSARAHTRLLLSRIFYERFLDYDFILIYHLDSLVFSDQLALWCKAGYDYIGPPWIEGPDLPGVTGEGVGNGGFSLRRIGSFIRVFDSKRRIGPMERELHGLSSTVRMKRRLMRLLMGTKEKDSTPQTVDEEVQNYLRRGWNEDGFWGRHASCYDPEFKVAPVEVALRFAFEANPRRCFERTNQTIPFGCHAWEAYDRAFWEPLLLKG